MIGFRNRGVGAVADVKKFHNQVYLVPEDMHMQRFFWRNLETDMEPDVLAVAVNNCGITSANRIATSTLYKSADLFESIYPEASRDIKEQTYIDDELVAAENNEKLHTITNQSQMDEISGHANMHNKGWVYSGDT